MKRKIIIHDNINGKVITKDVNIRNLEHFEIQRKLKSNVFRDKTKYSRKQKYKERLF